MPAFYLKWQKALDAVNTKYGYFVKKRFLDILSEIFSPFLTGPEKS